MVIGFFSTVFITLCHLPACCILSSDLQFRWWLFIWLHLLPLAVFIYMKSILIMFKMTLFTYALTSAITSNNVSVNRSSFYSCAVPDCHYCPVTLCNQLQEENIVFGSSDQLYCTVTVVLKVFFVESCPCVHYLPCDCFNPHNDMNKNQQQDSSPTFPPRGPN